MKFLDQFTDWLPKPELTNQRIFAAITVAVIADALQLTQIPVFVQAVDVIAMLLTIWLIGFHLLLLPTFAVEFIPIVDAFPTWTGCVLVVVFMHRKLPPTQFPPSTPPEQLK